MSLLLTLYKAYRFNFAFVQIRTYVFEWYYNIDGGPSGPEPTPQQLHQQRHQRPQKSKQLSAFTEPPGRLSTLSSTQANNAIINRLLLGKDHEALDILKDILAHLLHIVDLKAINLYILGILTKAIGLIKALEQQQQGA